jgi:glyoxylase-like metal-dependent hydrolase (beta-lactamase superfamily II)
VVPRLVDLEEAPFGPFSGSLDLAGDGRMLVVPTPGHTPGHLGLLVRDREGGWLLGGDLAHTRGGFEQSSPALAGFCRRHGVVALMSHDPVAPALVGEGAR